MKGFVVRFKDGLLWDVEADYFRVGGGCLTFYKHSEANPALAVADGEWSYVAEKARVDEEVE